MNKISHFLYRVFKWIKSRYQGNYSETIKALRKEDREKRKTERQIRLSKRFSGSRKYTPIPKMYKMYS